MIPYIDVKEILPDDSPLTAETMRVEIIGKTDAEIISIIADLRDIMVGMTYTIKKHFCGHEDDASCTWKAV